MIEDYTKLIVRKLEGRVEDLTQNMANGGASDWADYRNKVGRRAAFREALDIVKEAYDRYVEDPDAEDE